MFGGMGRAFGRLGGMDAKPGWAIADTTLDLDFANNRGWGAGGSVVDALSITRASVGMVQNSAGIWTSVASGALRISDLGLLVEESRTNSIRNNSNTGASAPSTLPTNWARNSAAGLTVTYAYGTENGLPYIDVTVSGTTGDATGVQIRFENTQVIAASNGQAWAHSASFKLVAGDFTNVSTIAFLTQQRDASGALLALITSSDLKASIGATLTRLSAALTNTNASTAFISPAVTITASSGVALSFTLRIAAIQTELGSFATSPILTTSAAVTRAADSVTFKLVTPWAGDSGAVLIISNSTPGSADANYGRLIEASTLVAKTASVQTAASAQNSGGANALGATVGSGDFTGRVKTAFSWSPAGRSLVANNGTVVTSATARGTSTGTTYLGNSSGGNRAINGYLERVAMFPFTPNDVALKALTQ